MSTIEADIKHHLKNYIAPLGTLIIALAFLAGTITYYLGYGDHWGWWTIAALFFWGLPTTKVIDEHFRVGRHPNLMPPKYYRAIKVLLTLFFTFCGVWGAYMVGLGAATVYDFAHTELVRWLFLVVVPCPFWVLGYWLEFIR